MASEKYEVLEKYEKTFVSYDENTGKMLFTFIPDESELEGFITGKNKNPFEKENISI
jgi:hypothetical protein